MKVSSGQTVCVFDIGGNKFRLIAFISYPKGKVYVLHHDAQGLRQREPALEG